MGRPERSRWTLIHATYRLTDQPLDHHRRVGAARQAKLDLHHAAAAVEVVLLGRANSQSVRPHDRHPGLRLELESGEVRHVERLNRKAESLERPLIKLPLQRIRNAVELAARQHELTVPLRRKLEFTARETQHAFDATEADPVLALILDPEAQSPVPEVRLKGVEVDEPLTSTDTIEGTLEVVGIALEVLEDRVMAAELACDRTACGPIAPGAAERLLETTTRGRLEL
jgi:hypothetical protein